MPDDDGREQKCRTHRTGSAAHDLSTDGGVPLGSVEAGKRVTLVAIKAGNSLAARLAAMGFVPGAELLVVNNRGKGPAVVEVKGTRLALGRGMTLNMRVK